MSTAKKRDNKLCAIGRRGKEPVTCFPMYSRSPQGMEICYTPTEKRVQALSHTARSLRTIFRKHKVKVEYFSVLPKYRVILPMSTQTILDAPPGYIGLYTHCFSFANLRLPLNDFFCEILLKENMLDIKSFKDKLPYGIDQNLQFQRLGRYPVSAHAFDDPILFLASLQSSWEHGQHQPAIFVGSKEMSFRNFIYIEEDEDLTFLPKDFSLGFNTGSPSVFINTEPVRADEESAVEPVTEPVNERMGTTTDSGRSPKGDTFVVHAVSVAARIRERKCKTRGGSSRPPVKRKLAFGSSTSRTVRAKASTLKDDTHVLSISDDDEDNHLDVDLLDLHDCCYARQDIMDNVVNRRSRELLKVIEKLRGEADVMQARKLARKEECEGLQAKCEAAMTDFNKNPVVLLLREKMSSLAAKAKEHKGNLDRLMLESQKWSGYQVILSALELKVSSLEAKKANLKATKALLRQEIKEVKHDRREVVSKVVPYACMEILYSDELGRLVRKLVKGYRPSYEKENTQASNDLATATFSWLNKYVVDASSFVEALLSKKPPTLQKPVLSRTLMPMPSSQLATPSFVPSSKSMSPTADIVKPSPSLNE
ncbi:hypothetical protein Tco_0968433 [Tanacetum coccineum]